MAGPYEAAAGPAADDIGIRRRPKDRKDQIVEAARQLIVARGYRNVSMADIAEAVGITAGALYRHFSNKAVLLGAVIDQSFDDATTVTDQRDLALPNVLCVGGSWLTPADKLSAGDWAGIELLAREAAGLRPA